MASTSDIKNGKVLEMDNNLWQITEFQHVKPGKGAAFVRTKIKNLLTGKVLDKTIPAGHKITFARVERRPFQFLYKDDMGYNFMNNETFEQVALPETLVNAPQFLKEGEAITILYHAETEQALICELPQFVELTITFSEPGVRGDSSSSNVTKPATLETGATINVPLFVNEGEKIKLDTTTGQYLERVKS